MESSIECVSSTDGLLDEDEISHPNPFSQFSSSKPSHTNISSNNLNGMVINPTTSVHELLECPVCTNSMYPPIHQVFSLSSSLSASSYFDAFFISRFNFLIIWGNGFLEGLYAGRLNLCCLFYLSNLCLWGGSVDLRFQVEICGKLF